jgi:hypothetical protein
MSSAQASSINDLMMTNLKMEAIRSSETSVHTRSTRYHIPEDGILHSHRRVNLRSYINIPSLEDVAAMRCIEHWYFHTKGFRHIAINVSDMAAISKDGNFNFFRICDTLLVWLLKDLAGSWNFWQVIISEETAVNHERKRS